MRSAICDLPEGPEVRCLVWTRQTARAVNISSQIQPEVDAAHPFAWGKEGRQDEAYS